MKVSTPIVGHLYYYKDERDYGVFIPLPGQGATPTTLYMMSEEPEKTVCIEPVATIPEWAIDDQYWDHETSAFRRRPR